MSPENNSVSPNYRKFLLLFLLFTPTINIISQNLTIRTLEEIYNKSNWEKVNQFLINKNWEYTESNKGNFEKYNTITWAFNKSYDDKASGWFYLYTYEGYPNKINYTVFNNHSYLLVVRSLEQKGYKLDNSQIEDNELTSTYKNKNFILKITTKKKKEKGILKF